MAGREYLGVYEVDGLDAYLGGTMYMIVHTESGYALSGVFSTLAKAYTYMETNNLSEDRYEVQHVSRLTATT